MPNQTQDKIFILVVAVVAFLAGMMLMLAIDNYKTQEEVSAVEGSLSQIRIVK